MIDMLIFDFDGVIVDTETPDYQTWRDVFQSHGVELDRSILAGASVWRVGLTMSVQLEFVAHACFRVWQDAPHPRHRPLNQGNARPRG